MYMNDVTKKDEIKTIVIQDLRKYGIKFRPKKTRPLQENRINRRVFKTHLHLLPVQTVTLTNGTQLKVPKIVHELCTFLITKVNTKGLFRKGGTKGRENDIQMSLDAGCALGDDYYEIDIASVLKRFLRELPEPLFPYCYHELFLHCMVLKENCLNAVLLACLLLPAENLNTLLYLMEFFKIVAEHSEENKMDSFNLAVVIAPTVLPIEQKYASYASSRLEHNRDLIKLLIENSSHIGSLPADIIERVAEANDNNQLNTCETDDKKKKKRRSGSFSRLFGGLKKMVGGKSTEEVDQICQVNTPDILITPHITRSSKKRKGSESRGFSSKKKCELLHNLPQGPALLSTPFTPSRTPISVHPNPKKASPPATNKKVPALQVNNIPVTAECGLAKEKRIQWALVGRRSKMKHSAENLQRSRSSKNLLERRWSAVSHATGWGRKKQRHSLGNESNLGLPGIKVDVGAGDEDTHKTSLETPFELQELPEDPEYIHIRKTEYEEIKNRMTAIEKRLSVEFDFALDENKQVLNRSPADPPEAVVGLADGVDGVQTAYKKTLEEVEALSSPTTDQLAKRLSRELKIRRSNEFKVIRSPSARKIGILRRRSRERDSERSGVGGSHLSRNLSSGAVDLTPRTNLKRGRPNNVLSGLPQPSPMLVQGNVAIPSTPSRVRPVTRSSSFHGADIGVSGASSVNFSDSSCMSNGSNLWTSAEGFFHNQRTLDQVNLTKSFDGRASLAKLRSQNAGMVLAKARLFDDGILNAAVASQPQLTGQHQPLSMPQQQQRKIGSQRVVSSHTFRNDDKRSSKKNSPRRRQRRPTAKSADNSSSENVMDFHKNKENKFNGTNSPKMCKTPVSMMPPIRRPLSVKSPKRIMRTPLGNEFKGTPLRALNNRNNNYASPHF